MNKLRILIVGYGAMGRAVEVELERAGHKVAERVTNGQANCLANCLNTAQSDVAIEFSQPTAAANNCRQLLEAEIPVVSGTTGWCPEDLDQLAREKGTPFLHAANFSIGVAVLKQAASIAASLLQPFPDFEAAMIERHHSRKKDAPSGTAKMLSEAASIDSMSVHSLRQGGAAGEHSLIFEGACETLTLTHTAHSRNIFAIGALRAAEWLVAERPIGLVGFDTFLERTRTWTLTA